MAQWTKRQGAGIVRSLCIGLIIAVIIIVMFASGLLGAMLGSTSLGVFMFFSADTWQFIIMMIFILAIVSFCVRTRFNWGGA